MGAIRQTFDLYDGIIYETPPVPRREEIAGWDLPKEDQVFCTLVEPDCFYGLNREQCNHAYETDPVAHEFIDRIMRLRKEGYWFYCNGIPTYLTGDHFFYQNFFNLDVGLPEYRDKDRFWFYMEDFCDKDPDARGFLYVKMRRDGFSYRAGACVLNEAITYKESIFGMVSKTGIDGEELFQKVVRAFRRMPEYLKPQVQNAEKVKNKLIFAAPIQRVSSKNRSTKKEAELNTEISYLKTSEGAYDGFKIKKGIGDEISKWEEADFTVWLDKFLTSLSTGGGKGLFGSSVDEPKDEKVKIKKRFRGAKAFRRKWDTSNYQEKDPNGRTASRLYRYFRPAYDGFEDECGSWVGKYGESIIETPTPEQTAFLISKGHTKPHIGSKEYLTNTREFLRSTDIIKYYEECRQRPFDINDAFCETLPEVPSLDLEKIRDQMSHNKEYYPYRPQLLVRGNFAWRDGKRDTVVDFQPDPNGRWIISWMPRPEDRNKFIIRFGGRFPANFEKGVFSCDPFDQSITSANKRSDGASHGFLKANVAVSENVPPESFICEYINRPPDVDMFYEDMLMQSVFFSWQIAIEKNKWGAIKYFIKRGYKCYLWIDAPIGSDAYVKKMQKEEFGIFNGGTIEGGIRQELLEGLQSYVYKKIGRKDDGEIGYCPFNRTLEDWMKFEPTERWTDFDATVSSMICLLAAQSVLPKSNLVKERKPLKIFPTFQVN
jgi:hypothetical protein